MKVILSLPVLLVLATAWFCWHQAKQQPSERLRWLAIAILSYLLFCQPVADQLLRPLERQYPAFALQPVDHIVVLGCSHADDAFLPISDQPNACSKSRLVEALRIWHLNPQAIIHLSGTLTQARRAHTQIESEFLQALGVPVAHIQQHQGATNTEQEAQVVSTFLLAHTQKPRLALVTNAAHLPRAMRWFAAHSLEPVAAPAEFFGRDLDKPLRWQDFIPQITAPSSWYVWQYETAALLQQQWQLGRD